MADKANKLIQSIWPLPGGNKRYLHTLDRMLKWAASGSSLTIDDAKTWMMSEYNVRERTAYSYVRMVIVLGALDSLGNGKLALSSFGKQTLEAEGEAKARMVADRFMSNYLAFPEVLAVYARADGPIHVKEMVAALQSTFPQWTSEAQFEYRAVWLLSLNCLRQVKGRKYEITELGKSVAAQFPVSDEFPAAAPKEEKEVVASTEPTASTCSVARLIAELEAAAIDSQSPSRLERAVGEAFGHLGFAVDQLGEPGETDVLVRADIGLDSYSVIVDTKARRDGKLQDLEVYTLQEHLRNNEADCAVVVAGRFAGGKVVRHARENGVVLMSVPILSEWLRLHSQAPLNLSDYRVLFSTPGLLEELPTTLETAAEKKRQWASLLVDLAELIQETYEHGLNQPLPSIQLFSMLVTRLRGVRYPSQQVQEAIALLTHPAIGAALGDGDNGISLAMNRKTLVQALRVLADQIETVEAETQE